VKYQRRTEMQIFLTDEELEREESLFAPTKVLYEPLEGKAYDVRDFVDEIGEDENIPKPPSSC
jgi:hypothetical protein